MSTSINSMNSEIQAVALRNSIRKEKLHLADIRVAIAEFVHNIGLMRDHSEHFAGLIKQLRNQLARHFASKVRDGFMEEEVVDEPRLSVAVDHLRAQHAQLFVMISDIADSVESLAESTVSIERLDEIVERLKKFDIALAAHEREESAVVHEATEVDLGGEG